jgi:hypothetical protein
MHGAILLMNTSTYCRNFEGDTREDAALASVVPGVEVGNLAVSFDVALIDAVSVWRRETGRLNHCYAYGRSRTDLSAVANGFCSKRSFQ